MTILLVQFLGNKPPGPVVTVHLEHPCSHHQEGSDLRAAMAGCGLSAKRIHVMSCINNSECQRPTLAALYAWWRLRTHCQGCFRLKKLAEASEHYTHLRGHLHLHSGSC